MIAYPNKLDPASCDLFQFRRASQPTMIHHDFAFPENHDQVFVVVVVVFNLPEMFRGGSPVVLDDDRAKNTSRFAVLLPNYAADDTSEVVVWVHVPDNCFFFFHLWMTRAGDYFSNDSDDHLCMANSRYHSATL
ncbi:hypothetical protein HU200_008795 [Digitaria exilis]|uniref:Uncharacterized protein n=1 Tax=Digitaria exilis TaxID=1010633 RepID=A0A835FMZ8_9POAL|nr:hypothetical protein HU200_008795 [Digitaria exilis]